MVKTMRVMRVLLALLSVAVCVLLCAQAVDIYRTGNRAENFSADGVRIEPVYSRQIVAERLEAIAPVLYIYAALAAVGLAMQAFAGEKTRPKPVPMEKEKAGTVQRGNKALYIALYGLAAVLIALGAANGGLRDVLVKAINICTECIGLG